MPRYGLGTVAVGRHLYAIGGCNSTSKFGTVEKYHPETDRWETMTPLRVPRSGAGKQPPRVIYSKRYNTFSWLFI